jgi:hypothetical protein
MTGDYTNQIIAATPGLLRLGSYRDPDVAIEIFAGLGQSTSTTRPSHKSNLCGRDRTSIPPATLPGSPTFLRGASRGSRALGPYRR